jgi:trans-aconitate 2-methyltransferase
MSTGNRDWDAATYDRISVAQQAWAGEQFERLQPLRGDELILDAGCGSGKITAQLVEMVPHGHVYAVDVAPSMVEHTQRALGEKVTASCQDLTELQLPEQVDVIFSNATFHWVLDHDKLFAALHRNMKPAGRLVAQCGGYGNINSFRLAADEVATQDPRFRSYFDGWEPVWNYQTAEATKERLERAGFADVMTWLEDRPTTLTEAAPFVRTVCLVRHLDRVPPELHEQFVETVLSRFPSPLVLEYVRLNMTARVPES